MYTNEIANAHSMTGELTGGLDSTSTKVCVSENEGLGLEDPHGLDWNCGKHHTKQVALLPSPVLNCIYLPYQDNLCFLKKLSQNYFAILRVSVFAELSRAKLD